jgi:type IV secretory pathway TrbD component
MALCERRVYRSLNEKFTIAGYNATEVVACYFGFYYGVAFKGFLAGTIVLSLLCAVMRYGKSRDPRYLEIILRARRFAPCLDAARRSTRAWSTRS